MSENNTVRSAGILTMVNGKKIRGELVCDEHSGKFYTKKAQEPTVEFPYTKINRLDNIRHGGTLSTVTVVLKAVENDGQKYSFELKQGLKIHQYISDHWTDKPVQPRTRADELRERAERLGERIQKPKNHPQASEPFHRGGYRYLSAFDGCRMHDGFSAGFCHRELAEAAG